ncbi:hypothetical protein MHY1_01586 [Methylovirgula sp. HY1]|nr:hypothetical protein MHY1_01586 [Methylovirgula sp. HY1]
MVSQLTTAQRLSLTNAPNTIDFRSEPKTHPLHHLYRDGRKRHQLLQWFKRAFGTEIAIDMLAGRVVPLHVGDGAEPRGSEHVTDDSYLERLRLLPRLDEQGDGMKSFVGMLLNILYGHHDIIFLDEPEAFLHPPQARLLGTFLGRERPANVQIFVATHSADFIRGALESSDPHLRIARICRQNDIGQITELATGEIERSWSDPVLRFSNVIDGLFHEKVVVCEADGDCRFYAAITEALRNPENHPYLRDVMFVQAGGKGGIPKLVAALKALAVPVSAVVDFDVFRQIEQLDAIIAALGGKSAEYDDDIRAVRENINKLGSRPNAREIKEEIGKLLSELDDGASELPRQLEKKLRDAIKAPPGWARAKTTGLGILDRDTKPRGQTLLERFKRIGLFVVPVGEIESFESNQTATKNDWVAAVLEAHRQDMATASSLSEARAFVGGFIAKE